MYIYPKQGLVQNVLSGLGAEDRYIQPKNVDPTTGRSVPSARHPVPWGVAKVGLRNIDCTFYQNSPRELVVQMSKPYTMEISTPRDHFIGFCHPNVACPEEIHQGASVRDPWRGRQCAAWKQQWEQQAAGIIADEEFRKNVTERVLDVAGITGTDRYRVKPAEFLEVVQERETRERPVKLIAFIVLAASGGILTFGYVRKLVKRRAAKKAAASLEKEDSGEIEENGGPGSGPKKRYKIREGRLVNPNITKEQCDEMGHTWVRAHRSGNSYVKGYCSNKKRKSRKS